MGKWVPGSHCTMGAQSDFTVLICLGKLPEDRSGAVSEVDFIVVVEKAMPCLHVSLHVVGGAC